MLNLIVLGGLSLQLFGGFHKKEYAKDILDTSKAKDGFQHSFDTFYECKLRCQSFCVQKSNYVWGTLGRYVAKFYCKTLKKFVKGENKPNISTSDPTDKVPGSTPPDNGPPAKTPRRPFTASKIIKQESATNLVFGKRPMLDSEYYYNIPETDEIQKSFLVITPIYIIFSLILLSVILKAIQHKTKATRQKAHRRFVFVNQNSI